MTTKRNIWLISDTHFGHDNIIKYCNRPFSDSVHMNRALRENWNSCVAETDIIYHLGDVYFSKGFKEEEPLSYLKSLNGHKRLILGNHDNAKDQNLTKVFEKILMWRMFPEFEALLTHVPVHSTSIRYGLTNYHGHIHNSKSPEGPYKNMSVEAIGYFPYKLGETKRDEG